MIEFISQYGFVIIEIFISTIAFVVLCIRKNNVVIEDTIFEKLISKLPSIISMAEREVGEKNGERKLHLVLGVAYNYLCELTNLSVEDVAKKYGKRIEDAIESILETPQKKGIKKNDDEKKKN